MVAVFDFVSLFMMGFECLDVLAAVAADGVFIKLTDAEEDVIADISELMDDLRVTGARKFFACKAGCQAVGLGSECRIERCHFDEEEVGIEDFKKSGWLNSISVGQDKVQCHLSVELFDKTSAIICDLLKVPFFDRNDPISQFFVCGVDRKLELKSSLVEFLFDLQKFFEEVAGAVWGDR